LLIIGSKARVVLVSFERTIERLKEKINQDNKLIEKVLKKRNHY